jgi:hypothetical protein
MKKLLIGLALATAGSLAIRKLAHDGHKLREHCRQMMRSHCSDSHADHTRHPADAHSRASCCADTAEQTVAP